MKNRGIDSPAAGETGQTAGTAPEDPGKHQSKTAEIFCIPFNFQKTRKNMQHGRGICAQPQYQRGRMQSVDQGKAAEAWDTQRRA